MVTVVVTTEVVVPEFAPVAVTAELVAVTTAPVVVVVVVSLATVTTVHWPLVFLQIV